MFEENEAKSCYPRQHNHELLGSVRIAGRCEYAHNHRFATVTSDAIPCDGGHVHEVRFTTDSCSGHHHEVCATTGPAVEVGCGRHVHFLKACTSFEAGHKHELIAATLIENPTCEPRSSEQ